MRPEKFEAELIEGHKGVTVVIVPFNPETRWSLKPTRLDPSRHGWLVHGTANGIEFDSYIGDRWGRFYIIIDEALRKAAGVSVGDRMAVSVKSTASLEALARARELSKKTTKPGKPRADALDPPDAIPAKRPAVKRSKGAAAGEMTFDAVREAARELAGLEEGTTHGYPALKLAGKLVAWMPVKKEVEANTLALRLDFDQRDALIEDAPDIYYLTDHYRDYPAVLARLARLDRAALRDLLTASWRYAGAQGRKRR